MSLSDNELLVEISSKLDEVLVHLRLFSRYVIARIPKDMSYDTEIARAFLLPDTVESAETLPEEEEK